MGNIYAKRVVIRVNINGQISPVERLWCASPKILEEGKMYLKTFCELRAETDLENLFSHLQMKTSKPRGASEITKFTQLKCARYSARTCQHSFWPLLPLLVFPISSPASSRRQPSQRWVNGKMSREQLPAVVFIANLWEVGLLYHLPLLNPAISLQVSNTPT